MSEVNSAVEIPGLELLVARIVEHFQPRKVILFGSYARGSPREESDLDLLVVTAHPPTRQRGYEAKAELQRNFPIELQLVFMGAEEFEETQGIVGGLAYPAAHEGKLLYEENSSSSHLGFPTGLDAEGGS